MKNKKLHIIITGEHGRGHNFVVHKKTVQNIIAASILITIVLAAGSLAGIRFFGQKNDLLAKAEYLDSQLTATTSALKNIQEEKDLLVARYEDNISHLEQDQEALLEGSISKLDEKSRVIQSVIDHIGIDVKIEEDPDHSGGPYIAVNEDYGEDLLYKTEQYLEILRKIPLGRPVPGKISSKFGRRQDPLVKKKAFHPGIDFRGNTGDDIKATADGVVKKATRNKVLGRYIILSHGNGYETIFAHMHKLLVKKGDKVTRGQVIGLIGNTGRSTGSHLHYGVRYNDKSIDPMKYLQVADLSFTVSR